MITGWLLGEIVLENKKFNHHHLFIVGLVAVGKGRMLPIYSQLSFDFEMDKLMPSE